MIKFFRKIRHRLLSENNFSKYLLYALGEILLVVIGILIAISLNNSNQQSALNKRVDTKLDMVRHSIFQDSLSMKGLQQYCENQIREAQALLKLMNEPMNAEKCEEFTVKFLNHIQLRTNISNRSIYDEMVNSGIFSEIKDEEIKTQIATYYQLADHFNDIMTMYGKDFREFKNQLAINGTISRSYLESQGQYSPEEKCEYIKALLASNDRKLIVENFIYTGIETYRQINILYSVLTNQMITGLPKNPESN